MHAWLKECYSDMASCFGFSASDLGTVQLAGSSSGLGFRGESFYALCWLKIVHAVAIHLDGGGGIGGARSYCGRRGARLAGPSMAADTMAADSSPIPSTRDYKTLPVYFEQNHGQTDSRVRFLSHGPGYTVFLTGQGTVLALRKVTALPQPESHPKDGAKPQSDQVKVTTASVWMNLSGARADAEMEGIDPLPGRVNYFIGNDSTQWHSDIPTYARVKYRLGLSLESI